MTSSTGNGSPPTASDDCVRRLLKGALSDQFKVVGAGAGQPEAVNWGAWSSQLCTRVAADCGQLASVFLNAYSHIFQRDDETGEIRVQLALKRCANGRCSTESGCEDLHCCRFFLFGPSPCKFGDGCRFGHDLTSDHNARLLRHYLLDQLTAAEVGKLLKISDAVDDVPKICRKYNSKQGCLYGAQCCYIHVCSHHIQGTCSFKTKCTKSHDLYSGQPRAVLQKRRVNLGRPQEDLIVKLRAAMQHAASNNDAVKHDKPDAARDTISATQATRPISTSCSSRGRLPRFGPSAEAVSQLTSLSNHSVTLSSFPQKSSAMSSVSTGIQTIPKICIFHLRGLCRFGDDCNKFHSDQRVSFQWQWTETTVGCAPIIWNSFGRNANLTIENDFSLPENDSSATTDDAGRKFAIDFNAKTVSGDLIGRVRRLCTDSVNSLVFSSRRFATLWKWYWQNTDGKWTSYEESDDIELVYKAKSLEHHPPGREYWIDMRQRLHIETTGARARRRVKRRPFFYGGANDLNNKSSIVDEIAVATHGVADLQLIRSPPVPSFPTNWSKLDDRQQEKQGFQLVDVQKDGATAAEFETIRQLFAATLPNDAIRSLKRVQNAELWEDFSRYRAKLEKKRGGKDSVTDRRLFHGTAPNYVDAICSQGFDFRLSGTSIGTLYGKGSYFARDAKYSKSYCQGGDKMFVVQVIVGDFTVGNSTYARPPPKDATSPVLGLYDSCVDNLNNPSIFVVFDLHQAYPEYIIEFNRS